MWPRTYSLTATASLPNPGYRPSTTVVAAARRQVATRPEELDYWIGRASGRRDAADSGWYFSGRRHLTEAVHQFLGGAGSAFVVTGSAGSGKSALLARAVTLTDPAVLASPRYAEAIAAARQAGTLPPPDAVDVALLAHNKETHRLLDDLIEALGGTPEPIPAGATGSAPCVAGCSG